MAKKEKQPKKKPAPAETVAAFQGAINDNTMVVRKKRDLAMYEIKQTDDAINALESALRNEKRKRRELVDRVQGLAQVLALRVVDPESFL